MTRLASSLLLVLGFLAATVPSQAIEQLDWCAPVVIRPDQRFWTTSPCEAWWPDDEIARRADLVTDGFQRPSTSTVTPDHSCFGDHTMASSKAYHDRLRGLAASYGRTLHFVYMARLDLVDTHTASTPGFDAGYLVDANKLFRGVTDFFSRDATQSCACGCEWSEARGPAGLTAYPGERMRNFIDASGGAGSYERKVHYVSPLFSGGTLAGAPRYFFANAAIANQTLPAYRAWRIEHMRDAMENGGFDAVELNNKFHQYILSQPPVWIGSSSAPNVAAYLTTNDTTQWSAQAIGYGYREYLAGWAAFADDLESAGIPFQVSVSSFAWRANSIYDDPSTPGVDEAAVIRDVARRARWVLIERFQQIPAAEFQATIADIESGGVATVIPYDLSCGFGLAPGHTPPALGAGLTVTPDAAQTATFTGTSIRVAISGTATGAWDADFWCHCPTGTCGAPDASTTGQTGSEWLLPASLCDANYRSGIGQRVPRVSVRRASYTAASTRAVTVCAAGCSNGRDDDRDGSVDYPSDPGCASPSDDTEIASALACDDGIDNEGDTLVDFPADAQCLNSTTPSEGARRSSCGLGAELTIVLAALRRWRRRATAA